MPISNPSIARLSAGLSLWALWALWFGWPGPARGEEQLTLLLTHPQPYELQALSNLVERGLLALPGLRVRGIYHRDEEEGYEESRKFLQKQAISWIELEELGCDLPADRVFAQNGCTPRLRELFDGSDGIILPGGADLPPSLYGEETSLLTQLETPDRHRFELTLLFQLLGSTRHRAQVPWLGERPRYLVLGICLGMQSINVASGGTLFQDIPSEIYGIRTLEQGLRQKEKLVHRSFGAALDPGSSLGRASIHPIRFVGQSETSRGLFPDSRQVEVQVVSIHHQALKKLGLGLEVLATSVDGKVVEAVRHKKYPGLLGVQFHPESLALWSPDHPYPRTATDPEPNFVNAWFQKDSRAQAFHRAFWGYVTKLAQASHAAPRAASPATGP